MRCSNLVGHVSDERFALPQMHLRQLHLRQQRQGAKSVQYIEFIKLLATICTLPRLRPRSFADDGMKRARKTVC
eukprot:SAG31_NODE_4020_length_3660_cov_2.623701_3_plen_74_part_00